MVDAHFDTDLFIQEVKKRNVIWDMECAEYKNRILRKNAWEELVEIFGNAGDSLERKKILGKDLMTKWKSIRDCYIKEKKLQNKPSGSKASKRTEYVYFKQLQFLDSSLKNNETDNNFESSSQNLSQPDQDKEIMRPPLHVDKPPPNKKAKINAVDKQIIELLQNTAKVRALDKNQIEKQDDDKLFCLSLVSELKKIPESRRLKAKVEILNTILRVQTESPLQTSYYSQSLPSYSGYSTAQSAPATPSGSYQSTPPQYPGYTTVAATTSQTPAPEQWINTSPSSQGSETLDLFE